LLDTSGDSFLLINHCFSIHSLFFKSNNPDVSFIFQEMQSEPTNGKSRRKSRHPREQESRNSGIPDR